MLCSSSSYKSCQHYIYLQIAALKMCRTEQLEDGEWIEDEDQVMQLKANFIISAFGSGLYEADGKIENWLILSGVTFLFHVKSWFLFIFMNFEAKNFAPSINNFFIIGGVTNIENHIYKQPDPEKLPVDHTNICLFVRGSNPRHTAQQSIAQPLLPVSLLQFFFFCYYNKPELFYATKIYATFKIYKKSKRSR